MNPILDPTGERPSAVYWRRRAIVFAAFAVVMLLMVRACGGDGPDLSSTVVQGEVPLVSTYTPTPSATATDSGLDPSGSPMSDPGIGDDPDNPYDPLGTSSPTGSPAMDPNMVDEAGQPLFPGGSPPPSLAPTKTPKPTSTPKPTITPSATPTSDSAAAGPMSCAKSVLAVKLRADQRIYSGTTKPKLFLGVKNTGTTECLVDMGSRALSFTIISGKDRIWSSDDCQGKGTRDIRTLKPGQTLWARAVWSKVRSKPGCPKGMPVAKPGTYVVEGSAGGAKAREREVFDLK